MDADSKTRNPLAPRVHSGFFASWHRNELNQRVLAHVRGLVNSRKTAGLADLRVIVTGRPPACGLPVLAARFPGSATAYLLVASISPLVPTPMKPRLPMRTGHSLGGALATLAAHDLQAEFRFPHLHCYTFGAPRTGNHAFAAETSRLVPETWHVINDRALVFAFSVPAPVLLMILTSGYCVSQRIRLPVLGNSGLRTKGDVSPATSQPLWPSIIRLHPVQ